MNARTAKRFVVWTALLALVVFIGLCYDSIRQVSSRTPPVTSAVVGGKVVWQAKSCIDCHTILGNGAYFAPDLTKVTARRDPGWLTTFLKEPKRAFPAATMPNLRLTDDETANLVAFLTWVGGVKTNGWPPAPKGLAGASTGAAGSPSATAAEGSRLYDENGCSSCHAKGGLGGKVGPDLSHVGSSRDAAWLTRKLEDPAALTPGSIMPPYRDLGAATLEQLVAYLVTLR